MVGDLVTWRPKVSDVPRANLLLFGCCGSGMSALINAMVSLWHRTPQAVAVSMRSECRVTIETKMFDYDGFAFLDTPGATSDFYRNDEFRHILNGFLPVGYTVNKDTDKLQTVIDENAATAEERKIHSCIFVVGQQFGYFDEDSENIVRLRGFIEEGVRLGYDPLVVVTEVDEMPDPSDIEKMPEIFHKLLGVNCSHVFPLSLKLEKKATKLDFANEKVFPLFYFFHSFSPYFLYCRLFTKSFKLLFRLLTKKCSGITLMERMCSPQVNCLLRCLTDLRVIIFTGRFIACKGVEFACANIRRHCSREVLLCL